MGENAQSCMHARALAVAIAMDGSSMMMRLAIVFALTAAPSPAAAAKDDMTCEICPMIVDDLDAVSTLLRCFSLFCFHCM